MSDADLSEVSVYQLGCQTSVLWMTGLSFLENRDSRSAMRKNNEASIMSIYSLEEVTVGVRVVTYCIEHLQLLVLYFGLIKLLIKTNVCLLKSYCIDSQDCSFTVVEYLFGYQLKSRTES